MTQFIRSYWKLILFFTLVGLIGGFALGFYTLDLYPAKIREELLQQGMTELLLAVVTAMQSAGYGMVLGTIGIVLSKKAGLWREPIRIGSYPLLLAAAVSLLGGLAMILPDVLYFGKHSQVIADSYLSKPSPVYILASMTYGAVIEEVMLRLFAMSLIAWLLQKMFPKKAVSSYPLIIANILCSLLFAAGHLPATFLTIGSSATVIFRCFLLNGGLGLLFGWLYRKHGLQYAMIAHGGCHLISKLIWILFL
jgi:membrane protease YdiL (CAAX protease family)